MSEEVYFSNLDWIKAHDDIGVVRGTIIFKNSMTCEDYKEITHKMYLLLEESQQKEIERLNSIIKEVREYIEKELSFNVVINGKENKIIGYNKAFDKILEILDKEKNDD